ncbi:Serine/threonine protein kinase [Micromonospora citrea]|uniref:Serine/threonine protein kinase n=1 Tax=Micromonospora citrea TaxID=47855 RepID=A0A1C6W1T2_9ACTN|nr:serine/threonine-protein kinase [Micromonospora citrea]SCL72549.1 Serine/threonine protein kinase [Micromonospora citrea]
MWDLGPSDPRLVGPYRTRAVLGEGGMGRVLLATTTDGRLAAVKLVRGAFAADDDSFRQRLHREALAARRVDSPHTARVIGADATAGVPWLAYEFHHGPTLGQALQAAGPLDTDTVLHLAAGLATALRDIHAHNFIHRDLSASNVLLTDDGPIVIDFGIARPTGLPDDTTDTRIATVTQTGMIIGNPGFMSPEQAMGATQLTPASDIFALGTVLVLAATGHNPFQGATSEQTRLNIMTKEPDLDRVPPRLRHIVEPCLTRDPTQRPDAPTLLTTLGPPPHPHHPWPDPIAQLTETQQAEIRRYTQPAPTKILPGPRDLNPTKIFTRPGVPEPDLAGSRARRPRRWLIAAPAAAVLAAAGVLWTVIPSGQSGAGGTSGAQPTQEPTPKTSHAFADAQQGDCFRNAGDMQKPDFRAADCTGGGVFEAVRLFRNTTDRKVCDYVDGVEWRHSVRDPDVAVCLVYRHSDGTAYNADQGDCVHGEPDGAKWSLEGCRNGSFAVVARFEGQSSARQCAELPDHEQDRYFTVAGMPELNVRLCLKRIGSGGR